MSFRAIDLRGEDILRTEWLLNNGTGVASRSTQTHEARINKPREGGGHAFGSKTIKGSQTKIQPERPEMEEENI